MLLLLLHSRINQSLQLKPPSFLQYAIRHYHHITISSIVFSIKVISKLSGVYTNRPGSCFCFLVHWRRSCLSCLTKMKPNLNSYYFPPPQCCSKHNLYGCSLAVVSYQQTHVLNNAMLANFQMRLLFLTRRKFPHCLEMLLNGSMKYDSTHWYITSPPAQPPLLVHGR